MNSKYLENLVNKKAKSEGKNEFAEVFKQLTKSKLIKLDGTPLKMMRLDEEKEVKQEEKQINKPKYKELKEPKIDLPR